jgi:hypothetical protein
MCAFSSVICFLRIEEVVMRLFLAAWLLVMSSSAVAQVPQVPQACALLRANLDEAYNRFILESLESNPDVFAKVLIMESTSIFINTQTSQPPTFVHTGSEYVRREDTNGELGHDDMPRLGHGG